VEVVNCNVIKKTSNFRVYSYVFLYNDIRGAFSLVYFKFYLELEPVFEIFVKIIVFLNNIFLPKSAVP
jgi:hypothetical protein